MQLFPDYGVIEAGTDVVVGDEIYDTTAILGRRKPAQVVADVDWYQQAKRKLGVITWAGQSRSRRAQEEGDMRLDLDRHGALLMDWLYEHSTGKPESFDVREFTESQDLPEGSARLLAQHLEARGLLKAILTLGGYVGAIITPEGYAFAQRSAVVRNDHIQRFRALRNSHAFMALSAGSCRCSPC
ncbi:hypothetical protein [Amycolatopsis sp. NPDC051061]|uniref:hypothetical protein n=1 Tax=Amycolatopsis sp. NPDC051061 TaxID=3155042 RepID=UPI00343C3944